MNRVKRIKRAIKQAPFFFADAMTLQIPENCKVRDDQKQRKNISKK